MNARSMLIGLRSGAEYSKAQLARAELAVSEYEQGRYVSELMKSGERLGRCRIEPA